MTHRVESVAPIDVAVDAAAGIISNLTISLLRILVNVDGVIVKCFWAAKKQTTNRAAIFEITNTDKPRFKICTTLLLNNTHYWGVP